MRPADGATTSAPCSARPPEAAQLLRLQCVGLHERLRMTGLDAHHVRQVFGVGKFAGEVETRLAVFAWQI